MKIIVLLVLAFMAIAQEDSPSPPIPIIIIVPFPSPPPPQTPSPPPPPFPPIPPAPFLPLAPLRPPHASPLQSRDLAKIVIFGALAVALGLYSVTVVIWILYKVTGWCYSSREMNQDSKARRSASVQMV